MASIPPPVRGSRRPDRRHVVGPLILLGAGVLLLLNNLGFIPWSAWQAIWPYWPLLLVLLGLEAFVTGRVAWGTLVLLIVMLPVVGLAVSASSLGARWHDATRATDGQVSQTLRQPIGGATTAAVEVEYGGGALAVGALADPPPDDVLLDGQVFGHGGLRFDARSTLRDGRRLVRVGPSGDHEGFDLGRVDLKLAPSLPTDLSIESGATEMTLDLERLQIPNLSIETGASRSRIVLPARGQTNARIEGGVAAIEVRVPDGVAARIVVDGGPNQIQIDERRFPRVGGGDRGPGGLAGGEYRSPDFDTAANRVTLRIGVGASRLAVQ